MSRPVRERLCLLSLCGAAFALRLIALDASGFWYDEAFSAWIAAKDWAGILEFALAPKLEHPPVYYFLLHAWRAVAGDSEFALRFFSLGFSLLACVLLYRMARHWFGVGPARWTLPLAAASPFLIVYAQEARMYTLVLCVSVIALDSFLRWQAGEPRAAAVWALATLASVLIHYYAALLWVVEHLLVWIARPRSDAFMRRWLSWNALLVVGAAGALALAPGPRETLALVFSHPLFTGRSLAELQRVLTDLLAGGVVIRAQSPLAMAAGAVALLPVAGGVWWIARGPQRGEPQYRLLLLLLVLPPLAAAAVPYIYAARYLFPSVPALIVLSALGFNALRRHPARLALALSLFVLANVYGLWLNYGYIKSPYREMAALVSTEGRPGDGLILTGPSQWPLEWYYLRGPWARQYIPRNPDAAELSDIDGEMRALQAAHSRLWVVAEQASLVDPGNNVPRWLSLNAFPVSVRWFRTDMLLLANSGHALAPQREWGTDFGEWLTLEGASAPEAVAAGDALSVELAWHARKPIPQSVQLLMTLRLLDAAGVVVAERISKPCDGFCAIDDWKPGETVRDRHGLIVPAHAVPGEYRLRLSVWAARRQSYLPVGASAAESLDLARVRVEAGERR